MVRQFREIDTKDPANKSLKSRKQINKNLNDVVSFCFLSLRSLKKKKKKCMPRFEIVFTFFSRNRSKDREEFSISMPITLRRNRS